MNRNTFFTVLITCLIIANFYIFSKIVTDEIPEAVYPDYVSEQAESVSGEASAPENDIPPDTKYIKANVSDTKSGPLLLVNTTHPYTFDNEPSLIAKDVNTSIYASKTESYSVKDINVSMNTEAVLALNKMLDDFSAHLGGKRNIIVTEAHRTYEKQQEMLDLKIRQYGENQTIAQTPGKSEHHTGYALDISTFTDGVMGTFTGENEYSWIFENAHKYGFILRYPESKVDITGISYESWHFRYVGIPHAQYIYRNGLALEEYIEMLALYPYESAQLEITDEVTGEIYKIYSVPVSSDSTKIIVPSSVGDAEYTLSGDNNGHIIVTVKQ